MSTRFITLFCSGLLAITAEAGVASDKKDVDYFSFLAAGLENNLSKADTGRGTIVIKSQGDFFAPGSEHPRTTTALFMFAGDSLRYDRTFDYERPPRKEAISGRYFYQYLEYPEDSQPSSTPNAYVRSREYWEKSSPFYGEDVDVKRMMQPHGPLLEQLVSAVEEGLATVEAKEEDDGTVMVMISKAGQEGDGFRLWFDPRRGFSIVREERIIKGAVFHKIGRIVEEVDDVWMLKALTWTKPGKKNGSDIAVPSTSKIEFLITELKLHEHIPEETFNLRGFDLPPRTRVWDMIMDVDYTLDPIVAIEKQVDEIMESLGSLRETPSLEGVSADLKKDSGHIAAMSEEEKQENDLTVTKEVNTEDQVGEQSSKAPPGFLETRPRVLYLLIALVIALFATGWWLRWRKSHGTINTQGQ